MMNNCANHILTTARRLLMMTILMLSAAMAWADSKTETPSNYSIVVNPGEVNAYINQNSGSGDEDEDNFGAKRGFWDDSSSWDQW